MPDPQQNVFGPMKHGGMVEDAMIDFLRTWMPTYLAEINRRFALTTGTIAAPKSYSTVNEFAGWPASALPAIIVIAPDEQIYNKNGDGSYDASYPCGVGGVVETASQRSSLRLAKLYMAAVRSLVIENATLGKRVQQSRWVAGTTDRVPAQRDRTLAGFECSFEVVLASVSSARYGPPSAAVPGPAYGSPPAPDPTVDPGELPDIQTTGVLVTEKEN